VSKDFGKSWKHLYDYVVQYDWSPKGREAVRSGPAKKRGAKKPIEVIYATVHTVRTGHQVRVDTVTSKNDT